MTRKQATIAVRSGLNDDEQYGCVVPPIHLSSTYNFTGFNEPRAHDYSRRGNPTRDVTQRALAESLGGVESLISHAATMTHAGMAPEARAAAGISETLLRISTGIEDSEDLIADLENGFRVAAKG
ncbi:TPA: PLP-dependent transferase [Enterobacter cloacae]